MTLTQLLNYESLLNCISLMQAGVFCFSACGSDIFNSSQHMWQWKAEAMCEIHMHDIKSHFQQDFLAYCTRPVCAFGNGMHWLLIQQFLNLFAQIKIITKSDENYVFMF